jgi:Ecdysteroid kinase-like family
MPMIPIAPSSITADWLSEVLNSNVRVCKVEQIAMGVGLLGRLFRVHLDGGPEVPATVVVKLPTLDLTARKNFCEDAEFYLREVSFYTDIGVANPLRPARPYFAAFDEATHDFVLVLEDLGRLRNADQIIGCSVPDAETVIDGIARHHAHWWDNDRLASLGWLKTYNTDPFPAVVAGTYRAAWPVFAERVGYDMSPAMRDFGERLPSLLPWYLAEIARRPLTFLHGDLRLDQLFFPVNTDDAPLTVLDWQITAKGRGAFDVAYFLSQSLTPKTRRGCEDALLDRYAERLAEAGIDYPRKQLRRDYRLTTAYCFIYPVLAAGQIEIVNDRQLALMRTMFSGAATAIEDHDALALRPD